MNRDNIRLPELRSISYTLRDACEHLAFGQKTLREQDPKPGEIAMLCEFWKRTNQFDRYLLEPGHNRYDKDVQRASNALYTLLKNGTIIATYNGQIIQPETWQNELNPLDMLTNTNPYQNIKIDAKQLDMVAPVKQYTVTLKNNGGLYINDGDTDTKISQTYPGHKNYEWLKFYFEHPKCKISKQIVIKRFNNTEYKYEEDDKISQCVFAAFSKKAPLMHCCFPICGTKEVCCTPTFTSTDIFMS